MAPTRKDSWSKPDADILETICESAIKTQLRTVVLESRRAESSTTPTNTSVYLGLGIGVGGALLLAIIITLVQIVRKFREHRRLFEAHEVEEAVQGASTLR